MKSATNLTLGVLLFCAVPTAPGLAQSESRQRAEQVLELVEDPSTQFQEGRARAVVKPYQTNDPSEAELNPSDFEGEILRIRTGGDDDSRALQASEDSLLTRPDQIIDADSDLLDTANAAHANADDLVGGYFQAGSGSCEDPSIISEGFVEHFCQKRTLEEERTCEILRNITVDRRDRYLCEEQDATYIRTCSKTLRLSCSGSSGPACRSSSVSLSSGSTQQGQDFIDWQGSLPRVASGCEIASKSFDIELKDALQTDSFLLSRFEYVGHAQIEVGGTIIGTWPSGGTGGELQMQLFGCGKKCKINHPAINGNAIGSCNNTEQTISPNIDLIPLIKTSSSHLLGDVLNTTQKTRVTLRVVYLQTHPQLDLRFAYAGPCCSEISSNWEAVCSDPSR